MHVNDRPLAIANTTLNTLVAELGDECRNVTSLINQLQIPDLTPDQQNSILADLLAATIHLHAHCDEAFQNRIAEQMEALPDGDEG